MAEVIQFADNQLHPMATCGNCGGQHWLILVDGFNDQWENIVGIQCSECRDVIKWVRAERRTIFKNFIEKLFYNHFPIYLRYDKWWLAAWSAPWEPCKQIDYIKALRITIRKGEFHEKRLLTLKKGIK